jgi:peptidoglycan/xylan/chitin deacetylase (PgdA/CDA1 family)
MTRGRVLTIICLLAIGMVYVGYRLYQRTNALGAPAIITLSTDVHKLLSPSLSVRWERLVHGNAPPNGPRPRLIALTFDDGPYPVDTPLLLAVLRDLHIHATFFLIGRDAVMYPGLVRRILADGNEVADHTLTHPNLDQLSVTAVRHEITEGARVLGAIAASPSLRTELRPPHGRYTEATLRVAQSLGYNVVLWNDDPGDWRNISAAEMEQHVFRHATAPEIMLLHSGRMATIEMLADVVGRYRSAGFHFVTVGQLRNRVSPDQLNHPARLPIL